MISCILLYNNELTQINVKNIDESNMYKKCTLKNDNNFKKMKEINTNEGMIEIWGKNKGLSNSKNNSDILADLNINIYGKSIIVFKKNNVYESLTKGYLMNILNIDENEETNNSNSVNMSKPFNNNKTNTNNSKKTQSKNEINEVNKVKEDIEDIEENEEEYLELTYDVYEYSDDE